MVIFQQHFCFSQKNIGIGRFEVTFTKVVQGCLQCLMDIVHCLTCIAQPQIRSSNIAHKLHSRNRTSGLLEC